MLRYLTLLLLACSLCAGDLTVGNATADIPVGTEITVTANPPATGFIFDKWIGNTAGLADVNASPTTLTMPAGNVSLTATYILDPDNPVPPDPPTGVVEVLSQVETTGVVDPDDMWLWEHPTDKTQSVLFGADKYGEEMVWWNLQGDRLGSSPEPGSPNNVDGRGNIFGVSLRRKYADAVAMYTVDANGVPTRQAQWDADAHKANGFCLYKSAVDGKLYAFVASSSDDIFQFEVHPTTYLGTLVRTIETAKVEGMAANDTTGQLFFAEENHALYVVGAEPGDSTTPTTIASIPDYNLDDDLEGVTLVTDLYVIVSGQRQSEFHVFNQTPPYAWRGNFEIEEGNGIDDVSGTDGIAFHAGNYGAPFPGGIFFAHSNSSNRGGTRSIKMVSWQDIATVLSLVVP